MLKYILKRLAIAFFILLGFSLILYTIMRFLPDNYIWQTFGSSLSDGNMTEEQVEELMKYYGLSDPPIIGYLRWLWGIVRGDFGYSFLYQQPVTKVISEYMWLSFAIAFISFILYFTLAVLLGIRGAVKQYSVYDYTITVLSMIGISLPAFFFSGLIVKVFAVDLKLFDSSLGYVSPNIPEDASGWVRFIDKVWHLILPITVMVILSIGGLMRYTRTNTLEVLNADYIRTARAKGLSERTVIYKHAFKNTMIPLATIMAGILPMLFSGSMIIEQVFMLPGIGNRAYTALNSGDIPFVMGYNMFLAILTVIGVLLSDIMYVLVDPRVKLSK